MQKTLLFKIAIILALMAVISVPLILIQATIHERIAFRQQAAASIAADSVGEQMLSGPVLVIPYTDAYEEEVAVGTEAARKTELQKRSVLRHHLVFPDDLRINAVIDTDHRYRGIHKVLVYSGQNTFAGNFILPEEKELARANSSSRLSLGAPFVALSISDVRGIRNIPKLNWGGKLIEFNQGAGLNALGSGLHAVLAPDDLKKDGRVNFSFDIGLDGIEAQHFTPVGKNNQVTVKSNWPHPQFGGRFLPSPKGRTINAAGFSATWDISSLATDVQQQLVSMVDPRTVDEAKRGFVPDHFTVTFIEPVNPYSMADRAGKYGLLFVALTFAAFFVFEILKRLRIHPIQYSLVGLALALFFLLLVALSEHIDFLAAYLLASGACIGLIAFYLRHVLHGWLRAFGFGMSLTVLYGALYGLLISENNALVLGSILLFGVLAAVMVATRKVNWYQVGSAEAAANA